MVARRTFLPGAETWRRRLADVRIRALESYAKTCLELGGAELPGAERAARELVEVAPFRESGHLLLIRALAANSNVAEALAAYERLRILLRDELGVDPGEAVQEAYVASSGSDAKVSPTLRQGRDNHAGECFHYDNNNNKQSKQYPVLYR